MPENDNCRHEHECYNRFDKIDRSLSDLNTKLFVGNGKPAFNTRMDRLEQRAKSEDKWRKVVVSALVVLALKSAWGFVAEVKQSIRPTQQTVKTPQ